MPSFVEICKPVLEMKIFEVFFNIYGHGAILVMCPGLNLALIGQVVSEEKMFEYYGDINAYCPGVGVYVPLESIFFRIIIH